MCEIVQRVWIEEGPNKKTAYVVLKKGQCICMRPADQLKCNKAASQLPKSVEPTLLASPPSRVPN